MPRDDAARLKATVLRHTRGKGCALLLRTCGLDEAAQMLAVAEQVPRPA